MNRARPADQALVSDEAPAGLHPSGFDPSREEDVAVYRAISALYHIALDLHEFCRVYEGNGKDGHIWQRMHVINERAWSAVAGLNHFLQTHQNLACPRCVRRADEETLAKWGPEMFAILRPNSAIAGEAEEKDRNR